MAGLTQDQLIDILNRVNETEQIRKRDLHEAIAVAITENNKKLLQDIQAGNSAEIQSVLDRSTGAIYDTIERNRAETQQIMQQHLEEYH
ncbi:hypothetical protein R9X47_26050 [Wukongibacter baidiensis]|uniref:hypothetical protein n=1 Tax=Wukongibacter baidiensis TaxID=1723361 RepID=UPI003D7F596E